MNTVFVVSEKQEHFNLLSTNYGHMPVHFTWARNMEETIKYAELENPAYLFFISNKLEELAGWLSGYRQAGLQAPFVCFTGDLDYTDRSMLWQSGAIDLIKLPVHRKEMEYILRSFLMPALKDDKKSANQLEGRLEDFSLLDLIQTFENTGKSGILFLESGAQKGEIEFARGKVVNGALGNCDPLEAVTIMSVWKQGKFYGRFDQEKHKERIALDNAQILLECEHFAAERKRLLKSLPDPDQKIFTEPDLEFEEFGPKDRQLLLKFNKGLRLNDLLEESSGNLNLLLKKINFWIERRWLLTEEDYQRRKAEQQAQQRHSAFKRFVNKIFSRSEKEITLIQQVAPLSAEDDFLLDIARQDDLYEDGGRLKQFADLLEKIS